MQFDASSFRTESQSHDSVPSLLEILSRDKDKHDSYSYLG